HPISTLFPYTTLFRSTFDLLFDKVFLYPKKCWKGYGLRNLKTVIVLKALVIPILEIGIGLRQFKCCLAETLGSLNIQIFGTELRSEEHTSELQSRENL